MKLTYGSLFAGVGGFDQGFDRAGMECRWQVEWDSNCQKLLRKKWPNAKHHGDITKTRSSDLDTVDVVCGGSPCQGLSMAGKRAGLADGRSGLFHEMVRVCKNQRRRGGARIVVWENVDGAFSSNEGRDFAAVLRAFTGMAVQVPSDGWGRAGFIKTPFPEWRWNCAWRLFDAQYFGVPQRRRRVFLVASAGTGSCAEILFEPESLRGDSPPSRDAGQRVAPTISSRTKGGGGLGTDFNCDGGLVPEVAGCLTMAGGNSAGSATNQDAYSDLLIPEVAHSLTTRNARNARNEPTTETLLPVVAFHPTQDPISSTDGSTHALGCGSRQGQASVAIAIQEVGKRTGKSTTDKRAGLGIANDGDPMFTLQAGAQHAVAYSLTGNGFDASEDGTGRGTPLVAVDEPEIFQTRIARNGRGVPDTICPALNGTDAGDTSDMRPVVRTGMAVRRLTPRECERLMGWPDDHTIGFSDSTRYKMCGNGIVASCSAWIGKRIVRFLK